jgi:phospholipid/cholesterol/gamma-HCH transport system substrate-binding protein
MKKEIKVGIFGLLAIIVLYFGFNFLKGLDLFSTVEEYRVEFEDVQGLESSNPVTYNGVNVGRVLKMTPDYEKSNVEVTLVINKKVKLTDNTQAILADNGLIGGKLIKLQIMPGKALAQNGLLKGIIETSLIQNVQDKVSPTLKNIDALVLSLTDILKEFAHSGQALQALMANASQTTTGVNGVISTNAKKIDEITKNAAVLTHNLNTIALSLDQQLKPILTKTGSFTDSLNALQLGQTVNHLNHSIKGLEGILTDINAGNGTLGKLASDDSLYLNLDKTAASLNILLADMKINPKRYVHFSLFGKKEKKSTPITTSQKP